MKQIKIYICVYVKVVILVNHALSLLINISFFLLIPDLYAQKENNIWYMGIPQGWDFNTSRPRLLPMQANVQNGGAGESGNTGRLLFYTNGRVVLDANHNFMPGSVQLDADSSFFTTYSNPNFSYKEDVPLLSRNINKFGETMHFKGDVTLLR